MPAIDPACLYGEWLHAHEEDRGEEAVYRPASGTFTPSRGREGFTLRPDGTCTYRGLSPTDQPSAQTCRWTFGDGNRLVLHHLSGVTGPYVLEVVSCAPGQLILRRVQGAK
ncbi:MAG TPA: hypothetical protein VK943_03925 [Arenibaculum sp.]|nr:hypothetical protein [Arenibaculum sp.]